MIASIVFRLSMYESGPTYPADLMVIRVIYVVHVKVVWRRSSTVAFPASGKQPHCRLPKPVGCSWRTV